MQVAVSGCRRSRTRHHRACLEMPIDGTPGRLEVKCSASRQPDRTGGQYCRVTPFLLENHDENSWSGPPKAQNFDVLLTICRSEFQFFGIGTLPDDYTERLGREWRSCQPYYADGFGLYCSGVSERNVFPDFIRGVTRLKFWVLVESLYGFRSVPATDHPYERRERPRRLDPKTRRHEHESARAFAIAAKAM